MARDPLAVLARLRALEVDAARRGMEERNAALRRAEAAVEEARAAPAREAALATPAAYAAWLPRAMSEIRLAELRARHAGAQAALARNALAAAHAAERAVERLIEARTADEARRAARKEQALLDEAGARRR